MAFELPPLPYGMNELEPHISQETLEYHYGKHHKTYVDKLNDLIPDSVFEGRSLEEIIRADPPPGALINNAAQVWNHTFYWNGLSPTGGGAPGGALLEAISDAFGSFEAFQEKFSSMAATNFGSGWTWLVKRQNGELDVVNTGNAGNPMSTGLTPLLTCDVWEHAYYIDYRNARPKYIEAFWKLVNWDFVAENFAA
jgi:Fe-Mn family superoxide dismutase